MPAKKASPLAIIILAAGQSTRMRSETPKVLHDLSGKPIISHVMRTAELLDPKHIITVIRKDMDNLEHLHAKDCDFVIQKKAQGTADAVKTALPKLKNFKGQVLILFGDTPLITPSTLRNLLDKHQEREAVVSVLGFTPDDAAQYGRLVIGNAHQVERIVEYRDANDAQKAITLCNSGVFVIEGSEIHKLVGAIGNDNSKGEYYLTDCIEIANQQKMVCSYEEAEPDEVLGINTRAELAYAENVLQQRIRAKAMEQGVTLVAPESVYLSSGTRLGRDVIIHPNVVIGSDVSIEDGVEIKSFSHIEGAYISQNAVIGPFARIRPGTSLAAGTKVGNFVEIKNSTVREGAKINHLSYIGDAEIGSNTNIGAGTITCNYDGKRKYHTKIGNDVFVGSNSALVAPVSIGDSATVAAGSTITENVESNALAIARNRQSSKENWGR